MKNVNGMLLGAAVVSAFGGKSFSAPRESQSSQPGPFPATAPAVSTGTSSDDLCHGTCKMVGGREYCSFTTKLDPYASATGYYTFEECGSTPHPVIAMKKGVTYTFDQTHATNWMHPLGFAYFPDGAHKDVDELEPGIAMAGNCDEDMSCQAPMYYRDNHFLGADGYDNSGIDGRVVGGEDFGLDVYEPEFFASKDAWLEAGDYVVRLTLSDDFDGDMFYFCHIHDAMSGRVKVVDANGVAFNADDTPVLGYHYHEPSAFDLTCGTYDLAEYQRGMPACEGLEFFCDTESSTISPFGDCLYAMDCHMHVNMKNNLHKSDPMVSFVHQMIPHHENAINMAKALLREGALDLDDEGDAEMDQMMWEIINQQNFQINQMRGWIKGKYPEGADQDRC